MTHGDGIKTILVLMSTYNGEKYLEEQLESLRGPKGVSVYCLVRDDGSIDRTVGILENYALKWDRLALIKGENIGCGNSFTALLKAAVLFPHRFDYLAFCDQDDVWLEDKLKTAAAVLETMPAGVPSLYCSNLTMVDEKLQVISAVYSKEIGPLTKGNALVERFGTGCTMVFNKKAQGMYLAHLPSISILHDRWVYLICLFFGKVHYDRTPRILYRQHEKNVVGAQRGFVDKWKSRMKSFRLLHENPRERHAQELLRAFDGMLPREDVELIGIVAGYRKNLFAKLRFFFAPRRYHLRMRSAGRNFWLRVRILFGSV